MKKVFWNSILVVATLCIASLLGEGMLVLKNKDMKNYDIEMWRYAKLLKKRSDDTILGFEHRLNKNVELQSVRIRTNNFGLRGPDIQLKSSKKRRMLFLGSSVTLGWGLPESQALPELIAAGLSQDVEVLNAGIGHYNMVRYVRLFMTKLAMLHPTDIVINYFPTDTKTMEIEPANWFIEHSQLAVTLWRVYNKILSKDSAQDMVSYYKSLYEPNSAGYRATLEAFDTITNYTKENNIRIYMLITPNFYYSSYYPYKFVHESMKNEAVKRDVKFIDPLPAFSGVSDVQSLWVMPTDHHPSAKANQIIADYCLKNNSFTIH